MEGDGRFELSDTKYDTRWKENQEFEDEIRDLIQIDKIRISHMITREKVGE